MDRIVSHVVAQESRLDLEVSQVRLVVAASQTESLFLPLLAYKLAAMYACLGDRVWCACLKHETALPKVVCSPVEQAWSPCCILVHEQQSAHDSNMKA